MEYLMTYGWAILIVAIVLIAIFQLGLFNNSNLAPRAFAGSCQVVRNAAATSLAGQCNNALPQYVLQLNGQNGYVNVGTSLVTGNQVTFVAWVDKLGPGNADPRGMALGQYGTYLDICYNSHPMFSMDNAVNSQVLVLSQAACASTGTWHQYVGVYNGASINIYVDGSAGTSVPQTGSLGTGAVYIGQFDGGSFNINGMISNVQIYNTSLSSSEVSQLYLEGVGGVPIDPTHIVAWWPLNGNAQDYSGNANNGAAVGGVSYSAT